MLAAAAAAAVVFVVVGKRRSETESCFRKCTLNALGVPSAGPEDVAHTFTWASDANSVGGLNIRIRPTRAPPVSVWPSLWVLPALRFEFAAPPVPTADDAVGISHVAAVLRLSGVAPAVSSGWDTTLLGPHQCRRRPAMPSPALPRPPSHCRAMPSPPTPCHTHTADDSGPLCQT